MRTIVIGILGIVLLAACSTGATTTTAALPTLTRDATTDGAIQVVLATSEFVVGPNRVALGILENNVPIADAAQTQVKTRFYRIEGEQAMLVGEEAARFYGEGLGQRGTFIVHPTFDRAGQWGLEVEAQRAGHPATTQRLGVTVRERGSAAMIGTTAPRTSTPTSAQVKDLKTISSSTKPDPRLYELSVDQAVTSGKPSLILFATPGFCQTQVCGPGVDVLSSLADTFGVKINTVHVEVYQYPFEQLRFVGAMREWGLLTEPWLFLVGADGTILNRYEGGITVDELRPDVEAVVGT